MVLTVNVKEENENTKDNVAFDRSRRDRKSYVKAVRRDPLLGSDEIKQFVVDSTKNDHKNKMEEKRTSRDLVRNWIQDPQSR